MQSIRHKLVQEQSLREVKQQEASVNFHKLAWLRNSKALLQISQRFQVVDRQKNVQLNKQLIICQ